MAETMYMLQERTLTQGRTMDFTNTDHSNCLLETVQLHPMQINRNRKNKEGRIMKTILKMGFLILVSIYFSACAHNRSYQQNADMAQAFSAMGNLMSTPNVPFQGGAPMRPIQNVNVYQNQNCAPYCPQQNGW